LDVPATGQFNGYFANAALVGDIIYERAVFLG
jgi:hypothetical protein